MANEDPFAEDPIFGKVISRYTRKQLIEDGVLVDISDPARHAGIKYPMAMTAAAFFGYIAPDPMPPGQDVVSRLRDMLTVFKLESRKGGRRNYVPGAVHA
jgi:hypothetical protein